MTTYPQPTPPGVPPAAHDPLAALFAQDRSGLSICANYFVFPASLMEGEFRNRLATLVRDVRAAHPDVEWPQYRVNAVGQLPIRELSPAKLDESEIIADLDDNGNLHYFSRRHPDRELDPNTPVLVTRQDPTSRRASEPRRP